MGADIGMVPERPRSDTALMLRAREGDVCAFEELYNRYYRRLLDFFYALGRNAENAEDLCHETFLRIWRLRTRYSATGSFPAYLFAFARRIWLEDCRRTRNQRRLGMPLDVDEHPDRIPAARAMQPHTAASEAEFRRLLYAALDELPEEQRSAFVMRAIDGLPLSDIAEAMGCPINTVRSRKLLAINKLRSILQRIAVF